MKTYAFIDASNIIYGTRGEGWKVDFKKLYKYLTERYKCKKVFYFAGLDEKNLKQLNFYKKLSKFGYELVIKKVKLYKQEDGSVVRKANCDVDLTFYAMRDFELYTKVIFMSGDGDFEILLKHILARKKELIVIANGNRTAREIKKLTSLTFTPMKTLKSVLEYKQKRV